GLLALLSLYMTTGDIPMLGAGVGSASLALVYLGTLLALRRHERTPQSWRTEDGSKPNASKDAPKLERAELSLARVITVTAVAAAITVVAGYLLAASAAAIAVQTRIGSSLAGMLLGGIATSLPELSTIRGAVKLRQYEMAFADAFGSNLFS